MDIYFNIPNKNYKNNKLNRNQDYLIFLPFLSIKRYFFWNYENLYFLILSIFQLLTLGPLPKEWSPTGAFSTVIPLIMCIIIEIIGDIVKWIKNWIVDNRENNKLITCHNSRYNRKKKCKDLRPGDVVRIYKDQIVPIDGILVETTNSMGKISLSLLTGESTPYAVKKTKYDLNEYKKVIIDNYYPNNFHNLEGKIILKNNKKINIDGSCFIVNGSIVQSEYLDIWVLRCGKDKKSYIKDTNNLNIKKSRLDDFIAYYLTNINIKLLAVLVFTMSYVKMYSKAFKIYTFIVLCLQNWILFNGIIPFSVKIMLIFVRNIQSILINRTLIKINNTTLLDDINKINRIISDKTGTLTKNELEFSKIVQTDDYTIHDINNSNNNNLDINEDFLKCLGLCIHQYDGVFTTMEDKTIRCRYHFLNSKVFQKGNKIELILNNNNYKYKYIEINGLDFTYDRKMSSKIVKEVKNDNYYIFTKGSLDKISSRIITSDLKKLNRMDSDISKLNPDLRLLACAFRKLDFSELEDLLTDSLNKSIFIDNLESNLNLLGVIGIKDNLQDKVSNVIKKLEKDNISTSMCTGDRKITALAIGKEANIINNEELIIDYDLPITNKHIKNIDQKTIVFSGNILNRLCETSNRYTFEEFLCSSKNFIAYNLIPEHKKILTNILEKSNIKILTIGDGFNDINMFKESSISVAIDKNEYVAKSADFSINQFSDLDTLLYNIGIEHYIKNTILTNYVFYRCMVVVMILFFDNLLNYNDNIRSIFNGFVIKGFTLLWCVLNIIYFCITKRDEITRTYTIKDCRQNIYSNIYQTTWWNITGIITALIVVLLTRSYHKNYIAMITIGLINLKLLLNIKNISIGDFIFSSLGILLFILYAKINN